MQNLENLLSKVKTVAPKARQNTIVKLKINI